MKKYEYKIEERKSFVPYVNFTIKSAVLPHVYIFWPFPQFLSKLKNREEFEGGLEKGREKGVKEEKKKRVIKHRLKYLYEA